MKHRWSRLWLAACLAIVASLVVALPAHADNTFTATLAADSFIDASHPDSTYCTAPSLRMREAATVKRTILAFSTAGLPDSAVVTGGTLTLTATQGGASGLKVLQYVPWSGCPTWNTAPATDATTELGRNTANLPTSGPYAISLTSNLGAISRTGTTYLMVKQLVGTSLDEVASSSEGGSAPTLTVTWRSATPKAPEGGFELRGHLSSTYPTVDHEFVNVDWVDLEPNRGDFSGPGWATIDDALATNPAGLKLRIFAGIGAPRWLDSISGPAVFVNNSTAGSGYVPRFWNDAYWTPYRELLNEVARRYEANPKVKTITACGAMTINCEPFIRAGTDTASNQRLYNAGLNETTDRAALLRSVDEPMQAFATTRVSIANHLKWQIVDAAGDTAGWSWPKERDLMNQMRANPTYGSRLVIQNNGIGNSTCTVNQDPATATDLYCYMRAIPGPKGFQGGYKGFACSLVLDHAVYDMGAWFFENIASDCTPSQVQTWEAQMKTNAGL